MTQEEKNLVFLDVCARMASGVYLTAEDNTPVKINQVECLQIWIFKHDSKPFLRSMESMDYEEIKIYNDFLTLVATEECGAWELVDWLNANFFDYRGLIKKGLAIEAPKGLYI